jgi:beta-lactam-binding protein with PASTA domain
VIGQDYWDAEIMLEANDFVVKIAYRPSTERVGHIIDQALVVRSPDDPVVLGVSSGPDASASALLPNVVGLNEEVATRDLESYGFQVQVEKRSTFIETDDGRCLMRALPR